VAADFRLCWGAGVPVVCNPFLSSFFFIVILEKIKRGFCCVKFRL
jgi:hypothetical protein